MPRYTPEEIAIDRRINTGRPWPEGPVAMLPVVQLYVRDITLLRGPGQADLLQVLWCPFDHLPRPQPRTVLCWRSAATVTDILAEPPEPVAVQYQGCYVPEPCLLDPEDITEYPNPMELSKDLQDELGQWSTWQAAGAAVDSVYAIAPEEFYGDELSVAPGWKVGGWTRWGLTDPIPQLCPACDTEMVPLLTIATFEWEDNNRGWIPFEDQAGAVPSAAAASRKSPAMVEIAGGYSLQLYACPEAPDHPHADLVQ